jgi:hypothetical protein
MNVRYFALILGIMFLLVGVLAFVPGLTTHPATDAGAGAHQHDLVVTGPGHGYLLGLFHVNILHNLVHLLFGVWGVIAYRSLGASVTYSRAVAIIYGVLVVAGLIPGLNTMFGLVPIHGNDVWLHLLIAGAAAYFGWAAAPVAHRTEMHGTDVVA